MISNTIKPEDREEIRQVIVNKIEQTKQDITSLKEMSKPISPENAIGRISRMDAINNKSINEAALRESSQRLIRLEYVLSIIDKPSFGICVRCEMPIPKGRLLLMPESTKCTRCS